MRGAPRTRGADPGGGPRRASKTSGGPCLGVLSDKGKYSMLGSILRPLIFRNSHNKMSVSIEWGCLGCFSWASLQPEPNLV